MMLVFNRISRPVPIVGQSNDPRVKSARAEQFSYLLRMFPELHSSVCFVDTGVIVDKKTDTTSFVFYAWTDLAFNTYQSILGILRQETGFNAASHPVFRAGCPVGINKESELQSLLRQYDTSCGLTSMDISWEQRSSECCRTNHDNPIVKVSTNRPPSRRSDRSCTVEEYVRLYASKLSEQSEKFESRRGRPLCRVVCASIVNWEISGTTMIPNYLGSIFVGFDNTSQDILPFIEGVKALAFETVGAPSVQIHAEDEGTFETLDAFAHQVRTIAGKVSSGWLVNDGLWNQNGYTKPDDFSGDKRAPLPSLYEAVSSVLTFWSMSVEPDTLFPARAREILDYPPGNIHDLARYAMYHAKQMWLVNKCESLRLSDPEHLAEAWKFVGQLFSDRIEFCNAEDGCRVRSQPFEHEKEKFFLDKNGESNLVPFKELSGVVRLLALHFENFLQHTDDEQKIEFCAECNVSNGELTLRIDLRNTKCRSDSGFAKVKHVGGHHDDVSNFIKTRFFRNQIVDTPSSITDGKYCTTITITNLSWLETNS